MSSLFVCVFHIVPCRHRIKRISGNLCSSCVQPNIRPKPNLQKIRLVNFFVFKKNSASAFCLIFQGFIFACRPNSYDQISSFLSDQNFSFSTKCYPFSIDVESSRYPLQKREDGYLCLVRNKKTFEPFLESKSIS